jgi:hypothetical protein
VTLVEQVWKKVDEDMLNLMQPAANTDFVALKSRLRAFAEVLAIFMSPHFTTADEVAKEAKRRYDNRDDPEYCTPGLNQRRYEPPPGTPVRSVAPTKATAPYSPPKAIYAKLKPEEIEAIKKFSTLGFTTEQMAKTYGVSKTVIDAVIAS